MREHPVIPALLSALSYRSVPAVLLAVGVGVTYVPRDGIDPEAIEAAARQPSPLCSPEAMGFRLPDPDDYPLERRCCMKEACDRMGRSLTASPGFTPRSARSAASPGGS
jgi:hypothetical protein